MNVKPGDMAICTGGNHVGKIGTVIESFVGQPIDGQYWNGVPEDMWPIWVFEAATHFDAFNTQIKRAPFPDSWLRPLSGLPEMESDADLRDIQD